MLLFSVCASAQQTYKIKVRAMEHGTISLGNFQEVTAGTIVTVTCEPNEGYGLSKTLFYASKDQNGDFSAPQQTDNVSTYPEDRANRKQLFSFTMPAGEVELWATFVPLRELVIHQRTGGKLVPLYGFKKANTDTLLWNVPGHKLILNVVPDSDEVKKERNILVDVDIANIDQRYYQKTDSIITVWMPNDEVTVHVTPTFGKKYYKVNILESINHLKATVSNSTPKAREEVDVTLLTDKDYIPANVSIKGCKEWWRVGKPKQQKNGGWEVVYRFKVDLQDVSVTFGVERVHSFSVNDTKHSGRIKTYIPEVIPDYPGVARQGQQVPVVFMMPDDFSVTHTVTGNPSSKVIYHNALQNSFADKGMADWDDSNDREGLPMGVFTDSDNNKYWRSSVKNRMSQSVSLAGHTFPDYAKRAIGSNDTLVSIAAIASMNPYCARDAKATIVATGKEITASQWVFADLKGKQEGWQTVFRTGEVNVKADTLEFVVDAQADNLYSKRSYEGPMFDDLCLLLPTDGKSIKNEDVLVFKMDVKDVTIDYTPSGSQNTASVQKTDHVTVTLLNTNTGEEGETVQVMENDIIVVKSQSDEGYAVYQMKHTQDKETHNMILDSINIDARKAFYSFTKHRKSDDTIRPDVQPLQVFKLDNYGGTLTINNNYAKKGEKVLFTVTPDAGCKLRCIKTIPADVATFTEENVDAKTGGGTYSFIMPTAHITLYPEFIVPITTAKQIEKLDQQYGEFVLADDIEMGDDWEESVDLYGDFNGNGHRITYGGENSLFDMILSTASVRHLYVNANLQGTEEYTGGIAAYNEGIIEDCEVSGTISSKRTPVGGVVGQNGPKSGTISYCHVLCDVIDGPLAYGIANQNPGGTIRNNVFNGQFGSSCGRQFMVCNDTKNSTIKNNYYIENYGNSKAELSSGVTVGKPENLVLDAKDIADTYPVYAASIKQKYSSVFTVTLATSEEVVRINLSQETAVPGTVINASVRVTGNNHLVGIIVSDTLGRNAQNCTFTDHMDYVYSFSFVMPAYDVKVTFKTEKGKNIYTAQQFIDINNVDGTFYLVQDIELNNWNWDKKKKVTLNGNFYGGGHTIKYSSSESCSGLFNKIRRGALLQGLRVVGFVETEKDCGGIALENQGTIRDCHFCGRISSSAIITRKIAAIACTTAKEGSLIDHCSATAELISNNNQDFVNKHPLCSRTDANISNSDWIKSSGESSARVNELIAKAEAARTTYPVYAEGILDKVTPRVMVGSDVMRLENGKTLDKLTLTDGEPFSCTSDIKVNKIIYKRKAMDELEQWILPFAFDRIAGKGTFEYHETMNKEKKLPEIEPGKTLKLSATPSSITYHANEPWVVKSDGDEFVLTNVNGPITVKATHSDHINRYASLADEGHFYVTYETIPAMKAMDNLFYTWNSAKQKLVLSGDEGAPADIPPYRFYLQFYNKDYKTFIKYTQTSWARNEQTASSPSNRAAGQSMASAVADGWQPVFLDPRQPQSVTARMLDYYEVACLTDISSDVLDEDGDDPLSAVSLIYQIVDSRVDLPTALPLLVRAKRSDAEPLVDEKMGNEIKALCEESLIDDEDDDDDEDDFDMPHYWCASFDNRLDIWHLPAPERYADLAKSGAMLFDDNYYNQSFLYASNTDTRTTAPMSYCITVLNTDTYELLPLMGDRVTVTFIPLGSTTGISLTPSPSPKGEGSGYIYNLSGQRVNASYKGIILQNGRKMIKR